MGSPRGGGEGEPPEGVGKGFLTGMMGSISSGFETGFSTVGNVVGAMKFWEGDGSKSPRHHFNEGEIFKGMFEAEHDDTHIPTITIKAPPRPTQGGSSNATSQAYSGPSALRVPGAPSKGARVQFEGVEWRNHEVLMDGSGGLPSSGTPLGIGWKVQSERWVSIDDFEESREGVRRPREIFMMDGFVPPKERTSLFYELGHSKEEVSACELATFKNNRRRKQSVQDLSDMVEQ